MLTNGNIKQQRFSSFSELNRAVHLADIERANNLKRTQAARAANRKAKKNA